MLGAVLLVAMPKLTRNLTAVLVLVAACVFFASYERLREGIRKPFLIHSHMFSNGLAVAQIATINDEGLAATSGWVARAGTDDPVTLGREVFRVQCAACHTLDGYQGIRAMLPDDPDMMAGPLFAMWEMGETYSAADPGQVMDTSALDYPFMPPFVGTEEELMALAEYLTTLVEPAGGAR